MASAGTDVGWVTLVGDSVGAAEVAVAVAGSGVTGGVATGNCVMEEVQAEGRITRRQINPAVTFARIASPRLVGQHKQMTLQENRTGIQWG